MEDFKIQKKFSKDVFELELSPTGELSMFLDSRHDSGFSFCVDLDNNDLISLRDYLIEITKPPNRLHKALQAATDEVNSWPAWKRDLWKNSDKGFSS